VTALPRQVQTLCCHKARYRHAPTTWWTATS